MAHKWPQPSAASSHYAAVPSPQYGWLIRLISPFVATLREHREMRYLWNVPVAMDNTKLTAVQGYEPHTPLPGR